MASITLRGVSKRFGDTLAVDSVDLEIRNSEFLALLGPSGCGKTTVLRLIAGFDQVTSGEIAFDDAVMSGPDHHVGPEQRRVGIVFQSYALWPHMSVERNVGYPLQVAKVRGDEYRRRVAAALADVGLGGFERRRPAQLSGGQRQRVALARCLVMEPSLVLLDEPLANLDVHLRAAMEDAFVEFHEKTGATMIYITHDQAEAMAMADRVAVMDGGRVVQSAEPRRLYREPGSPMAANFIGDGVVVDAVVNGARAGGRCDVLLFGQSAMLRCPRGQTQGPAQVSLRPEDLALADQGVPGIVKRSLYRGGASTVEVVPDAAPDTVLLLSVTDPPPAGAAVRIAISDGWVIPPTVLD